MRYVDSTGAPIGAACRYAHSLNSFGTLMAPGPMSGALLLAGSSSTGGTPPLSVHPLLVYLNAAGDSVRASQYVLRTADGGYVFTSLVDSAGYELGALTKVDGQLARQWTYLLRTRLSYSASHRGI